MRPSRRPTRMWSSWRSRTCRGGLPGPPSIRMTRDPTTNRGAGLKKRTNKKRSAVGRTRNDGAKAGEKRMEKRRYRIGIIPGDGIGRDVIKAARIVLDAIDATSKTFALDFKPMDTGDAAVAKYGHPFPKETLDGIAATDAVLFGAAGNPHTVAVLMGFRLSFNLYANVRPIKALPGSNALKTGANLIVVRENTEGLYRGIGWIDGDYHVNLRVFTTKAMERIIRFCFQFARK